MRGAGLFAALCGAGLLAGCATGAMGPKPVDAKGCVAEYRMQTARHGQSAANDDAYRACLARVGATPDEVRAAANQPSYTPEVRGTAAMTGGTGYRGSYRLPGAMPPPVAATPSKAPKPAKGKLPLPTQYPLMPGDAALWPTLTRQQQERAIFFLQHGSTIRSSLESNR